MLRTFRTRKEPTRALKLQSSPRSCMYLLCSSLSPSLPSFPLSLSPHFSICSLFVIDMGSSEGGEGEEAAFWEQGAEQRGRNIIWPGLPPPQPQQSRLRIGFTRIYTSLPSRCLYPTLSSSPAQQFVSFSCCGSREPRSKIHAQGVVFWLGANRSCRDRRPKIASESRENQFALKLR